MPILESELRSARNWSADAKGSIHDDATAAKLGFRGGTVAGNIHMDQFPPALLRVFGKRFFEDGALSLYFLNATTNREAVRAYVEEPSAGGTQVRVFMKREDGLDVSEGTASVGDASKSALRMRERIERGLCSGPLDWYTGPSPFGGPIAAPSALVELLWAPPTKALGAHIGKAVGLFGAIEVAHLAGPVFLEETYTVTGRVAAVGLSPKTEYLWFDALASDARGRGIASMRILLRFMKASSPLYP
jgi:ribosomal protein S18 acetylase RimI-like enzyme